MIQEELSRISEGSREGASISSTFFSAASSTFPPSLRSMLCSQTTSTSGAASNPTAVHVEGGCGARSRGCVNSTSFPPNRAERETRRNIPSTCGDLNSEEVKKNVKAFVQTGVKGQRVEALRR